MILIITNEADHSTNLVLDWLHAFSLKYLRVNQEDELATSFENNDIVFYGCEFSFSLSEIKCVWYRRGFLNVKYKYMNDKKLDLFLKEEISKIKEYIYYKLSNLPSINDYRNSDANKLIVNDIALKIGLNVPFENLISDKKNLDRLRKKHLLATKSIAGSTMFFFDDFYFVGYTSLINSKSKVSKRFFPSLVQKYIDKKYELRIFYMNGICWTMAIFSQLDEQTKVDFRNYNNNCPNRSVPFNMPSKIRKKLIGLMEKLNLNCGSIDMIVTRTNEYFFLEVNPVGQFGMVSNPCNYNLHKEIALNLKGNYE